MINVSSTRTSLQMWVSRSVAGQCPAACLAVGWQCQPAVGTIAGHQLLLIWGRWSCSCCCCCCFAGLCCPHSVHRLCRPIDSAVPHGQFAFGMGFPGQQLVLPDCSCRSCQYCSGMVAAAASCAAAAGPGTSCAAGHYRTTVDVRQQLAQAAQEQPDGAWTV